MNALDAALAQSPGIPELLASPEPEHPAPVVYDDELLERFDEIVASLGSAIVDSFTEGAKFARRPAGYDDGPAWALALTNYAHEYARLAAVQVAEMLVRRSQEGPTTRHEELT